MPHSDPSPTLILQSATVWFEAREPLRVPEWKEFLTWRGALGLALTRQPALYDRLFDPPPASTAFRTPPRPLLLRPLQPLTQIAPPDRFGLQLTLLQPSAEDWVGLEAALRTLEEDGFGPHRSRVRWVKFVLSPPRALTLGATPNLPSPLRITFLTPTEWKHEGQLAHEPHFEPLIARLAERFLLLHGQYGSGPVPDLTHLPALAKTVRRTATTLTRVLISRRSSRTGETHPLGGWLGSADFEGDFGPFLPLLQAGQQLGVGRHAAWGYGQYEIASIVPHFSENTLD